MTYESQLEKLLRTANIWLEGIAVWTQNFFEEFRPEFETFAIAVADAEKRWTGQPASAGIVALLVSNGHHPLLAEFCRNAIAPLSRRIAELLRFEAQS